MTGGYGPASGPAPGPGDEYGDNGGYRDNGEYRENTAGRPPFPDHAPDPHHGHPAGDGYLAGPGGAQGYGAGYGPDRPGATAHGDAYGTGAHGTGYGEQHGGLPPFPGSADPGGAQPYGHEGGYGPGAYGAGYDATYVPEPLSGQVPVEAEPGAAFGAPSSGDAWAAHTAAPDGYGSPPVAGGWEGTPAGAQPWEAAPAGTGEHAGAYGVPGQGTPGHDVPGAYGVPGQNMPGQGVPGAYGAPGRHASGGYGVPAQNASGEYGAPGRPALGPYTVPGQNASGAYAGREPHGFARQQAYEPYPPPAAGGEHTAVLPRIDDPAAQPHSGPGPAGTVRTGSPIIPPGVRPAGLTAALGLLMAGGAALGKPGLAVLLVALQALTAAGWFRLNGMWPARQGIALAFLSGVTADVAILAVNGGHGPFALAGTLGVWLLLVLVLQLRHHGSADERLSSLTATSASALLTVLAAMYLATATSHAGTDPVVVGTVAVAAATLVRAPRLPGGEAVSVAAALLAAAVTALATGPATGFGTGHALLLAAACGAGALIGLRVASYDWPSRFVHFTAGVALPLTAAAPVVYLLGRALG